MFYTFALSVLETGLSLYIWCDKLSHSQLIELPSSPSIFPRGRLLPQALHKCHVLRPGAQHKLKNHAHHSSLLCQTIHRPRFVLRQQLQHTARDSAAPSLETPWLQPMRPSIRPRCHGYLSSGVVFAGRRPRILQPLSTWTMPCRRPSIVLVR